MFRGMSPSNTRASALRRGARLCTARTGNCGANVRNEWSHERDMTFLKLSCIHDHKIETRRVKTIHHRRSKRSCRFSPSFPLSNEEPFKLSEGSAPCASTFRLELCRWER